MNAAGLIGALSLDTEEDVVTVRQHARRMAELLGLDRQDQVRLATAVSEIARQAIGYGGGEVRYAVEPPSVPEVLVIGVSGRDGCFTQSEDTVDRQQGLAIAPLSGLQSARRLVDSLEVTDGPAGSTTVLLRKFLSKRVPAPAVDLGSLRAAFSNERTSSPITEMRQQHRELLASLDELRRRQEELSELNSELEDTNRGVVALYAEIEERADALRQANELKSRFLSHMSHEFRTPLNAIVSLTRLLLDRSDGELTDEQERQVHYVRSAALGLTELVNDLLDLAKVQAGKADVQIASFRVIDLFGALRGMLRPLLGSDSVSLVFDPADHLLIVSSDEAKVSQILRNFISNALKFTESGEVRVCAQTNPDAGTVTFAVRDTGIGIEPQHQQRIFEEFVQIDSPIQRRVKGTGLGLALSGRLADLLGGRIWLESTPGEGSTFFLEIPLEPVQDDEVPAPDLDKSCRILIVDDEETSRYIIRRLLKDFPCTVSEAVDGKEGLLRARVERPDLIVLDLGLPVLDGYTVLARLKDDPQTSGIPVVIVTASVIEPDDRRRLERAAGIYWKDSLSRDGMGELLAHALPAPGGEHA